jgi:hypothetical protein
MTSTVRRTRNHWQSFDKHRSPWSMQQRIDVLKTGYAGYSHPAAIDAGGRVSMEQGASSRE